MSVSRLMVLGVTHKRKKAHGYNVISDLRAWEADEWTDIKIGSIYHAISKMCDEGLLISEGVEDSKLGPDREKYSLTDSGNREFLALVKRALSSPNLQELAAGVAFMSNLARQEATKALHANLQIQQAILSKINSVEVTEESIEEPFTNPELVTIWRNHHQANINSLESILCNINEGRYSFNNSK